MKVCEILFWISVFIVCYTYIGYGILLYVLVKIKECFHKTTAKHHMPTDTDLPELTLFIAAYNEENVVNEKMSNCLSLDYPMDKLHILWVTDGSDDRTNEYLSHWTQVTVLHQPERQGKTDALNRGMRLVKTPLVVFTDANTNLNRAALREIVHAFTNPEVGCVAGEKRIAACSQNNAASGGEGMYWKYESALKALDSRLYSTVGAAGELFAIRSELFKEMKTDTLLDDFILSLHIVMQGYTIAYCANAYAIENGSANMNEEEKRKVRIAAGGLQSIWRLRPLLNPFRYGIFSFQYISHRVLRWSLTPILLFLLLPLNAILIFTTDTPLLYAIIWLLQALFYLMGSWGYYLSTKHVKNKILFIPYYFLFMNINVIRGFNYLHKRKDNTNGAWEKARRA
ncbi:glycosyltransferase family 2 protein [Bacteroides helcogenes]|uniref:Glycosyl transferase family 2 n=1 Tax=Bacteroides helcogenes (strain ATCC 35417 / DSM 20613 / JCM 6297 / CCUG 15421 / P 36-108) TaxID=693979 RepID=E6SWC1_BACT6|nr:glycosyltransferase family 2 protein [Bacteroides helcogenes]ADV44582.1 glycosyl transferase family 2 [Bacteroides helcogenes P 36-108]MDY5238872.1 glycosyltransferase family 2 protein [Bacteroides helcogenes]